MSICGILINNYRIYSFFSGVKMKVSVRSVKKDKVSRFLNTIKTSEIKIIQRFANLKAENSTLRVGSNNGRNSGGIGSEFHINKITCRLNVNSLITHT